MPDDRYTVWIYDADGLVDEQHHLSYIERVDMVYDAQRTPGLTVEWSVEGE